MLMESTTGNLPPASTSPFSLKITHHSSSSAIVAGREATTDIVSQRENE
jgi:hypothetical protein